LGEPPLASVVQPLSTDAAGCGRLRRVTTTAGRGKGRAKPFFIGVLGFVVAAVVVAVVAFISISQAQGDAYCEAIAQEIQRAEAQGPALEPHAEQTRRQYEEECR
jgi:hypothetical protein